MPDNAYGSFESRNQDANSSGFRDKLKDTGRGIADKWRNLPRGAKIGIPAGGTAAAVAITGIGLANTSYEEELSPEQFQSGQLAYDKGETALQDGAGRPALLNYFTPGEEKVLKVSLATQVPEVFREGAAAKHLDGIKNHARSSTLEVTYVTVMTCDDKGTCSPSIYPQYYNDYHHYDYPLDIEKDFVPANKEQENKLRDFFKDFTKATGIAVQITHDDPDAHITVANYRNEPDRYKGTLDYVEPGEIVSAPPGAVDSRNPALKHGFIIMNERNGGTANGIEDDIAKTIGFESGKVNWLSLREQLVREGLEVPQLNAGDSLISLEGNAQSASFLPERVIVDNGGQNTLAGTEKNDSLVTEAGYCGVTDTPRNKLTNVFGNGKEYCIAEGEIAVVKAGEGDDLIITSRAGKQQIDGGKGDNRIVFFQPEIGDKTILAGEGNNNLLLHDDLIHSGHVQVTQKDDDITLHFTAPSGREIGKITLENQLSGGGINELTIVDDEGIVAFKQDVKDIVTLESWQNGVIKPMEDALFKQAHEAMAARLSRRNQGVSGVPMRGNGQGGGRGI